MRRASTDRGHRLRSAWQFLTGSAAGPVNDSGIPRGRIPGRRSSRSRNAAIAHRGKGMGAAIKNVRSYTLNISMSYEKTLDLRCLQSFREIQLRRASGLLRRHAFAGAHGGSSAWLSDIPVCGSALRVGPSPAGPAARHAGFALQRRARGAYPCVAHIGKEDFPVRPAQTADRHPGAGYRMAGDPGPGSPLTPALSGQGDAGVHPADSSSEPVPLVLCR